MSTITPSDLARRIAGTFIEDEKSKKPPLLEWIQSECRYGRYRQTIEENVKKQPEPLRSDLVVVEKVDPEKITLRIPCRVADHESPSTFGMEVSFELNPVTQAMTRI